MSGRKSCIATTILPTIIIIRYILALKCALPLMLCLCIIQGMEDRKLSPSSNRQRGGKGTGVTGAGSITPPPAHHHTSLSSLTAPNKRRTSSAASSTASSHPSETHHQHHHSRSSSPLLNSPPAKRHHPSSSSSSSSTPIAITPNTNATTTSTTTQTIGHRRIPSSASTESGGGGSGGPGIDALPDGTLLYIFDMVWSGRPSYGDNDGRRQLGDIALVCRQWRDLANSDELWKPLCIARWPWLKSLKGGPAELLPPLAVYKHQGEGRSPMVWHEFCVRHGRCMNKAGIGRRTSWGSEYSLSVEIFDRKGGFRLFCSYGRVSIMQQNPAPDGRWLTKLAITGFASCWHFSASSRDPVMGRFENIRQYFERSHERSLEHCLCTEVSSRSNT